MNPDNNASTTLSANLKMHPVYEIDLETVTKLIHEHTPQKIKGTGVDTDLLRMMGISARKRVQSPTPDLRMVVRIQRKNKHPHSTKKHK
jgi:hypothetical protein